MRIKLFETIYQNFPYINPSLIQTVLTDYFCNLESSNTGDSNKEYYKTFPGCPTASASRTLRFDSFYVRVSTITAI